LPDLTRRNYTGDTAISEAGEGRFEATITDNWLVGRGAHGGFLAGVTVRAMLAVAGHDRPMRSFTMHFMRPPTTGPITVTPVIERAGRSAVFLSARVGQDGRTVANALAALSSRFVDLAHEDSPAPKIAPPDELAGIPKGSGAAFLDNFDLRWGLGEEMFSGSDKALVGGWLRTDPPELLDTAMVATFMDTFPPAVFPLLGTEPLVAPTLDYTVHFRDEFPLKDAGPDDFYLGSFTSSLARDGFFEEDGRLWDGSGRLIAQSRQMALLLKPGD
jgi:acyl-CoA thioesterase